MDHTHELMYRASSDIEKPELVFVVNPWNYDQLIRRLSNYRESYRLNAVAYLDQEDAMFELPQEDLFGETRFGYNQCGLLTSEDGQHHFRVQVDKNNIGNAVVTLANLFLVLSYDFEGTQPTNELQLSQIQTIADSKRFTYGHAVGGYVSSEVVMWLREYVKKHGEQFPKEVLVAMRDMWEYIVPLELVQYTDRIEGYLRDDGSFILTCFGDACDMGIYPDLIWSGIEEEMTMIEFQCHNLDTAYQQLTLLAGFARLLGLVRTTPL